MCVLFILLQVHYVNKVIVHVICVLLCYVVNKISLLLYIIIINNIAITSRNVKHY